MVNISIIIPTYKRKDSLLRLLASLFPQMTKQVEVIIVEQGEDHRKFFEREAKKHKKEIRYFYKHHANTARAKNFGARHAKGTYLVFYDDDVVLKKDALKQLIRAFAYPMVGIVGGRVTMADRPDEKGRTDVGKISFLGTFSDGFSSIIRQEVDTVIGCHMAVKKDVFDEAEGFDERFMGAFREESDLCLRIKKAGWKVLFEPSATVLHDRAPRGGARKTEGRMKWFYMFFHNETYFFLKHRPSILLPLYIAKKYDYIIRCMVGVGREVSIRSFATPWKGIAGGIRSWKKNAPYIIGIDAGALSIRDDRLKVGVWRVNYEFLRRLSQVDPKREYRLYSFYPLDSKIMQYCGKHVHNVILSPSFGYATIRLPLELFFHPVDTFLGLSQAFPPTFHGKKIGMIYDLRYKHDVAKEQSRSLEQGTERVIQNAKRLITISHFVKDDIMRSYGIGEDHITVAYPGVSEEFTPAGRKAVWGRPYFLFVGSLRKGKNIPALIEAFHQFTQKSKKQYDLLLVGGDYWMDPLINKITTTLQMGNHVHQLGCISDKELAKYYRGAKAMVTATQMEGFGLSVVEAMACGCPVIVPRIGALPEIVGSAGIFVRPEQPKDIVRAMQMLEQKEKRKQYRKLGILRAKRYTWDSFTETVKNVL